MHPHVHGESPIPEGDAGAGDGLDGVGSDRGEGEKKVVLGLDVNMGAAAQSEIAELTADESAGPRKR